jgi:hypothetical protein
MISRLTTFAALFAVLATASLSFAASAQHPSGAGVAAAKQVRVVQLERIVIVAKRL